MLLAGWLWMILWIVALLIGVWLLVHRTEERSVEDEARTGVRARFARGEITADEFEQASDDLEPTGSGRRPERRAGRFERRGTSR